MRVLMQPPVCLRGVLIFGSVSPGSGFSRVLWVLDWVGCLGLAVWGRVGVYGPHPPNRFMASLLQPGVPPVCHFLGHVSAPLNWVEYR